MNRILPKAVGIFAVTMAALIASPGVQASLIGQLLTHECPQCGPPFSQQFTVTQGLGPELAPFAQWTLDVEASTILVTWTFGVPSTVTSPLDFIVKDILGGIFSVTVDASSTFLPTALNFTQTAIDINLDGSRVFSNEFLLLNVNQAVSQVPEPATLLLMAAGLAGIGLRRKPAA